jgi:hypothetical protein
MEFESFARYRLVLSNELSEVFFRSEKGTNLLDRLSRELSIWFLYVHVDWPHSSPLWELIEPPHVLQRWVTYKSVWVSSL